MSAVSPLVWEACVYFSGTLLILLTVYCTVNIEDIFEVRQLVGVSQNKVQVRVYIQSAAPNLLSNSREMTS